MKTNPNDRTDKPDKQTDSKSSDIQDSPRDQERLRQDEATIDMPEVRDIPGQEHIHVPPLGELADTTISSDDEEGAGVLDDLNEEDDARIRMGTEADVSPDDRKILKTAENFHATRDEENLRRASLDTKDFEGEPLNEASLRQRQSGSDLDVPGSESDDTNEKIGEEDEENNSYSLGDTRN